MPSTPQRAFRLSDEVMAKIEQIGREQHGLTNARVIAWAVEELHARVFPAKKNRKSAPTAIDTVGQCDTI